MGTVKPWQIAVIVVGLIGAIGMSIYSCSAKDSTSVSLATEVNLIDVKTGEAFVANYPETRPVSYPAKHPQTGESSLYPMYQKDGSWFIVSRAIPAVLKHEGLKADLLKSSKTGELSNSNLSPKRADIFGN